MGEARRKFTRQYKADAVQLYQDSGLTMGQVAQQLGIGESTLQSWVKNVKDEGDVAAGETPLTHSNSRRSPAAMMRRLRTHTAFGSSVVSGYRAALLAAGSVADITSSRSSGWACGNLLAQLCWSEP